MSLGQRTKLLASGFNSTVLKSIEIDLSLNLNSYYFNSLITKFYSFSTTPSENYSVINLPVHAIYVTNGLYTFVPNGDITIDGIESLTEIDPRDTDQFYFSLFGNQIIVDSDGETKYVRLTIHDKSIDTLDYEVTRYIYALLDYMFREDPDGIFFCLRELSSNFVNKINKRDTINKKHVINSIRTKAWQI